jgi:hypothetical protein
MYSLFIVCLYACAQISCLLRLSSPLEVIRKSLSLKRSIPTLDLYHCMLKQYLLFLLLCMKLMGKHLLRTWLDVLSCYLVQPCLSNALCRLLLSLLNMGMVISWLWNATQSCVWNILMFKDKIIYNHSPHVYETWRTTQDNSTTTVHMALA